MLIGAEILFLATFVLQRNRSVQRAELRKPDAPLLGRAEHFVERQEDTDGISELAQTNSLVWLVSKSGSGKSSLLQSGLYKNLQSRNKLVIYLDDWGTDWVNGPSQAPSAALVQGLGVPIEIGGMEDPASMLISASAGLRQQPVLIVDQADDYVIRHRSTFWIATIIIVKAVFNSKEFFPATNRCIAERAGCASSFCH
jgi:hypothetical protein